MKIIFALLPEKGHINPFIGPAQALIDLGHSVGVVSSGDISEQIEAAGLEFHADLLNIAPAPPQGKELVELMKDKEGQLAAIENGFIRAAAAQVSIYEEFLSRENPRMLVIDPMNYAAIIAAEKKGIAWVGISSSLSSVLPDGLESDVLMMVERLKPKREELFRAHGLSLKFRAVDCLSPLLNITFATEDFVGQPPTEIQLVGPSLAIRERGDEREARSLHTERPIIYASFGSQVYYHPEVFAKIVEASKLLDVFVVLSLGNLIGEPEWRDEPAHCQFYDYAPQRKLLERARLFITHGGANSIMESIVAGVPVLVSPVCNDQAHQAYFVKKAGVGDVLDLRTATVNEIRDSIDELLRNSKVRERTAILSESYNENGALRAARLIDSQLRSL